MEKEKTGISIHNLVKKFGNFTAVDRVSFEIPNSSFFSLLGASGCGKTTILRMIAGFETPTSGDICIDGVSILNIPIEKRKIGVVFQNYALFPHMTVNDNIAYGLKFAKLPKERILDQVSQYLRLMGLDSLGGRYPHELSGGQQQRVALARALAPEPKLLLLDEPLSNLDVKLRDEMREELMRVKQFSKITMVYVTHDQGEALYLSDQIAVLKQGRVMQQDSPKNIYHSPQNDFVAGFVGETNLITRERLEALGLFPKKQSASYSLRPEKIQYSEPSDFSVVGTLRYFRFFGVLSTLIIDIDGKTPITAYHYNGNKPITLKEGDPIKLCFNEEDLIPIAAQGASNDPVQN